MQRMHLRRYNILEEPHSQQRCCDATNGRGDHMGNWGRDFDGQQTGNAHHEAQGTLETQYVSIRQLLVCPGETRTVMADPQTNLRRALI